MKVGYARVSTIRQGLEGNSLEDQEEKLRNAGAEVIYKDTYTGTTLHRPKLEELIQTLHDGDTFLCTKLDRVARSTADGLTFIQSLRAKGVTVHILNMGRIDDSPIGKLTLTMFFAFAEFERDMIVERTQAGKAVARKRADYVEGRPAYVPDRAYSHWAKQVAEGFSSVKDACNALGISKTTWYKYQ